MSVLKKFGLRVRQLRETRGWSQEDFAEKADLHRTYVSGIERGARNPTLTVLDRIAGGFGMPIDQLLEGLAKK
jgi:transcriptional regulator with XRE-family HTH domain